MRSARASVLSGPERSASRRVWLHPAGAFDLNSYPTKLVGSELISDQNGRSSNNRVNRHVFPRKNPHFSYLSIVLSRFRYPTVRLQRHCDCLRPTQAPPLRTVRARLWRGTGSTSVL